MKRVLITAALALAVLSAPISQAKVHAGAGIGFGIGIGFGTSCWRPPCPQYAPPPAPGFPPMGYGYGMPPAPCYNCADPYGMSAAYPAAGAAGPAAAAAAAAAPGGF